MSTPESHDYDLIDRLAEEFAERIRNGQRPSVQEYCDRYPHVATDLRDMLPALAEVEQVKDEVQAPPAAEPPKLRQVGDYHILREVGRGGMGVVYEAEDTRLTRRVALKVLATGKAGHALERFKREARAAARLHHTNIVPVFGVGDHGGLPYYVMQFIQGLGLDEVLDEVKRLQAKSGSVVMPSAVSARPRTDVSALAVARSLMTGTFEPPSNAEAVETLTHVGQVADLPAPRQVGDLPHAPRQVGDLPHGSSSSAISLPGPSTLSGRKPTYFQSVAQIGLQVADALDYAHKQGILHRDIKPSNLLLDLHGVVWVTDFGLAKAADQEDLTHTGDVLGTLRYMPPEAFEGKSEVRSDVYSLGLTMYELLALRPAYDERKKEQLVKQVTTTDPPRLGTLNRAIPRDLQTIVHKAIEKDPDHRYKSAAALGADLRRFLADQTILARRVSAGERFARWCRRNPAVAGLAATVFVLLVAGTAISTSLAIQIDRKARETEAEAIRANDEANRATGESNRASLALAAEAAERARTQTLLAEEFVARGARFQQDGDVGAAARCYAEALRLDPFDPDRAEAHRVRVATALREAGRPHRVWFHDALVMAAAVSPDGRTVAVGLEDGTVHLWDVNTGKPARAPLSGRKPVQEIAFAAGGKRLWVVDSGRGGVEGAYEWREGMPEARLVDLETGADVTRIDSGHVVTLGGSADEPGGRWVKVEFGENAPEFRDFDTGAALGPPLGRPGNDPAPPMHPVVSVRAGRVVIERGRVAKGDGVTREAEFWDLKTGRPVGRPVPCKGVVGFAGPNGEVVLILAPDGTLQWYDAATGDRGPTFAPPAGLPVAGASISRDGRRVLVAYHRSGLTMAQTGFRRTTARLLDARTGRPIVGPIECEAEDLYFLTGSDRRFTLNWDGTRMLSNGPSGRLDLWTADGVPVRSGLPDGLREVRFSPDGGYLVGIGADNAVRVWSAATGRPVTPRWPHPGTVRRARFTPDGSHILTVSGSGVWLWPLDARAAGSGALFGPPHSPGRMLSADGRRVLDVANGTNSTRAVVRDAATGRVVAGPVSLQKGLFPRFGRIAFRQDGRAALVRGYKPADGTVTQLALWDCDSGQVHPLDAGEVRSAEFSPDGRFVRTLTVRPATRLARLWNATSGERIGSGVEYGGPTTAQPVPSADPFAAREVAWSADSSRVALIDNAGGQVRCRVCDPRTGADLAAMAVDSRVNGPVVLEMTPDGAALMAAWQGPAEVSAVRLVDRVRVWEAGTGQPLTPVLEGSKFGGDILRAVLAPAGDRVAVVVRPRGEESGAEALQAASPFSRRAAAVVHVWDVAAGREVGSPLAHERGVLDLRFHPGDDRLVTTTPGGPARLWSATTGGLLLVLAGPDHPTTVRFSADGRRVVTIGVGSADSTLFEPVPAQVVDVRTGQPLTPVLDLAGGYRPAAELPVSIAADRLLVTRPDGTEILYELRPDPRPAADLIALAELLGGRQVTAAGLIQGIGPADYQAAWLAGRKRFAADLNVRPVEGLAWHQRQLAPQVAEDGQLRTRWHLDRLVAARPDQPFYRVRRGYAALQAGDWAAADADLTWALDRAPGPDLLAARGRARAGLGRWADAEADLTKAGSSVWDAPIDVALLRLRRGDRDGYRAACQACFAAARSADRLYLRIGYWPGLLMDGVLPELGQFNPDPIGPGIRVVTPFHVEAATRYRQGNYPVVAKLLGRHPDRAADWYLLAMAQHRMGKPEAKASLEAGRLREADPEAGVGLRVPHWQVELANSVLRKEAEGLIEGKK